VADRWKKYWIGAPFSPTELVLGTWTCHSADCSGVEYSRLLEEVEIEGVTERGPIDRIDQMIPDTNVHPESDPANRSDSVKSSSQPDDSRIPFTRKKSIHFHTEGSEAQLVQRAGSVRSQTRGRTRLQEGKTLRRLPSPPPPRYAP
jgi:hypothetical protein